MGRILDFREFPEEKIEGQIKRNICSLVPGVEIRVGDRQFTIAVAAREVAVLAA